MLRHLAPAFVCALLILIPSLPNQRSKPAPLPKISAPATRGDDLAATTVAMQATQSARDASGYPHEVDMARLAAGEQATAVGPSIEAAIGKERDAKINVESDQTSMSQPLTREAICQVLGEVAEENDLPAPLFTRLIWQESRFRNETVSRAGAQGIAQFMPQTAAERGLKDPFNPIQALPASGRFLRDLIAQFGNFGLAAAAYNGGPGRVSRWLAGKGGLPRETRNYVLQITGRTPEHWAEASVRALPHPEAVNVKDCEVRPLRAAIAQAQAEQAEALRTERANVVQRVTANWIALLTGNWSQQRAQAVYANLQKKYPKVLGRRSPTVRVAKATGKRSAPKTHVQLIAESRAEAEELCKRLREAGGSCTVQKDPA
jgi:soluble lytic murein transglycosylase-like protein